MAVTTFGTWLDSQAGRQDLIGQLASLWRESGPKPGNATRPRASAVESVGDWLVRVWVRAGGDEAMARDGMVQAGNEYHQFRQGGPPPAAPPSQPAPAPMVQAASYDQPSPAVMAALGRIESGLGLLTAWATGLEQRLAPLLDLVEQVQASADAEQAGDLGGYQQAEQPAGGYQQAPAAPSFYGGSPPPDGQMQAGWWDALAQQAGDDPAG